MATEINALVVSRAGGTLPATVTDASVFIEANDGNAVVLVHNPTGADVTITLEPKATLAALSINAPTIIVPAGSSIWAGPLPPAVFNDDFGRAYITDPSGALTFVALRF